MVEIIKYDDFPYSSKYKQKHTQSSFYELLGNIFSKEFKEQLWNLYKEINIIVSYNEYLEDLIEEVRLLIPRVPFTPYVPRYTFDTDGAFQVRLELNKLQHESWFQEIKINKIEEIKNLIKPMNNPYSQLSKFLNTSSYLPFELYFEDVFEKGNKNNLSFVEFFDKLVKENKAKTSSVKGSNTKPSISDRYSDNQEQETKPLKEKDVQFRTREYVDYVKTDEYEYQYKNLDDCIELHILCPNVLKDNLNIIFSLNTIRITKSNSENLKPFEPIFNEIIISRDFNAIDVSKATSKLENGVLEITLPKLNKKQDEPINVTIN
jgi:HSP20 family molecular chaperone IbpA